MEKKRSVFGRILPFLLVLLLIAAMLYVFGPLYPDGRGAGDDAGLADWMSALDGSRPLSTLNIPGTHDSATQYIFPAYFLQDQDTPIARQLTNGYRYLDVRVALDKTGKDLVLVHAFGQCRTFAAAFSEPLRYDAIVDDTLAFLDAHPGETVIFCVKPERGSDDVETVRALIERRVGAAPDRWYAGERIPTLDEARGKIVLCRRYDGALGLDFDWLDQGDARVLADPVEYHAINDGQYLAVQDRYHYAVADKWPAVRYTLENCEAGRDVFSLNFLSTAQGKLPHPRRFAGEMNALFASYELERGRNYGVVLFDFAAPELARRLVESN